MIQHAMDPDERHQTRAAPIGRRAVVVGAGVAGLATAAALTEAFSEVVVLERDNLPDRPAQQRGTSQGWHAHGILTGGQIALQELFPGIGQEFLRADAVLIRASQDLREEWPNRDPMPQRDLGMISYTMSRPLIESTLRRRNLQLANVTFWPNTQVAGLEFDGQCVTGVRCAAAYDEAEHILQADLVVDASGRGELTGALLQTIGYKRPSDTSVGIDLYYTTAVVDIPDNAPPDWKVVITHPHAPYSSRRAVMLPIEGNRWMMTVAGRGTEKPPAEWEALLAYIKHLPTPTIHNAVKDSRPVDRLARFFLPESIWRHFEAMELFPDGLIPVGDAICRFNPVYGQGMSVAAKEAVLLRRLLRDRAAQRDPLSGLGKAFFAEAQPLIETPWTMAAIPDFVYPETRGHRPPDLERSLLVADALSRIAMRDAAVQKSAVEVWHLVKPRSVLQHPELMQRVEAEMVRA